MKKALIICLSLIAINSYSSVIIFKKDGKEVFKLKDKSIKSGRIEINQKLIGSLDKTLYNAWKGYERTYRGYSFYELLNAVYGKDWVKAKTLSFSALDGYKQIVSIKKMLKFAKNKKAYIAYTETGKKGFTHFKKKEKTIDPGPYYLVWSNFLETDKASHGDHLKWPYQLKTIEIK